MTSEQTIDEIMKAAADLASAVAHHHNMPCSLRAGVAQRKEAALRHAIVAALAAKDAEIERLKAQLAEPAKAEPGEWIEWAGGECPVSLDRWCRVRFRDGDEWVVEIASDLSWEHYGGGGDVVAYRVLP